MASAGSENRDLIQKACDEIRRIAPAFARAAEHLGRAMRGAFLKLQAAVENADLPTISELFDGLRNSELVTSIAAKFHDLREKADRLCEIAAPFMGVAAGVILGLAGFWLVGGGLIGAVLVVAGFLYAAQSAVSVARPAMNRATEF